MSGQSGESDAAVGSSGRPKRGTRREAGRSRKGCAECRKRKVKCDEARPQCGQCLRAGRSCSIIDGLFRAHPYTFSVPGAQDEPEQENFTDGEASLHLKSRVGHTEDSSEVDNSHSETAVLSREGSAMSGIDGRSAAGYQIRELTTVANAYVEHPADAAMNNDMTPHDLYRSHSLPRTVDTPGFITALDRTRRENVRGNLSLNQHVGPFRPIPTPNSLAQTPTADHDTSEATEVAMLLRTFAESLADGMDVFCLERYFRRRATHLARNSRLVRYAACAVAAKQLGQAKVPISRGDVTRSQHSILQVRRSDGQIDYLWYGAKYYGKAVQSMSAEIVNEGITGQYLSPAAVSWEASGVNSPSAHGELVDARTTAAIIMCQYEELSVSNKAWSSHLDGIHKLLKLDNMKEFLAAHDMGAPAPGLGAKPTLKSMFWSFVRNDFEESFMTSRPTRVETTDLRLWIAMGLPLGPHGRLLPGCFNPPGADGCDLDFAVLHTLLWLMCRLANHIATKVRSSSGSETASQVSPSPDDTLTETWNDFNADLKRFESELPGSCRPDITKSADLVMNTVRSSLFATETWYTSATCAMAMIYFHMTRILFLLHADPTAISPRQGRLQVFRSLQVQLMQHAKDIFSIVLGGPGDSVRMHLLQPLYVAGRCLTKEEDQRQLVDMLSSLERDLGIATGYRVKALVEEWGSATLYSISGLDGELSDISSNDG